MHPSWEQVVYTLCTHPRQMDPGCGGFRSCQCVTNIYVLVDALWKICVVDGQCDVLLRLLKFVQSVAF